MKKYFRGILCLAALMVAASASGAEWTRVAGGPGTECSHGTPYAFFVHAGRPDRLLVYFQGGGACWSGATCDPHARSYKPGIRPGSRPKFNGHNKPAGIFDLADPRNPVGDYTMVYVTYCTADTFLGDRIHSYQVPDGDTVRIHHAGHANAMAALRWVYKHVRSPETVLVTGESAGAEAAAFYAGPIADHYPHARIVQLPVSLGAFGSWPVPAVWGVADLVERAAGDSSEITQNAFIAAAAARSNIVPAIYDTVDDDVQLHFLRLFDPSITAVAPVLARTRAQLRAEVPRVHTYTAPGSRHTILAFPDFYTLQVNGVRFRDWLANLLNGQAMPDVVCNACLPVAGK